MKVGIFYNSISNPKKFSNKTMLMDNFKEGVLKNGDTVIEYYDGNLPTEKLDAGFVLGYTLEDNFRKKIINTLAHYGTPRIFVDSNILHYGRQEHEYHRYSMNSVYPNDGIYFFDKLDETKWEVFSQFHGITLKPWRTSGNHIIIFCQRPKGWNMFGIDQEEWLDNKIAQIRQFSQRPIVVRMHPGDGKRFGFIEKLKAKYGSLISISEKENIKDELVNAWATVGYNSTPNVVAAIEGIPCFVEDPIHSWAKDVAFTDLSLIENPPLPDRAEWITKIANIHWSNEEVKSGKLWSNIKSYISSARS